MTRTTQEVFDSHKEAIERLDLDQLAGDYADDAILVSLDGSFHGREEIMAGFFKSWIGQFPDLKIIFEKVAVDEDVCLLQWSGEASKVSVRKGVGVFIIQEGLIKKQVEWYELIQKEA